MKTLATILALAIVSVGVEAQTHHKTRHSAEHNAAVKKCNADYLDAVKFARSLKGMEHSAAIAKARADKKQCLANAPR
jgi:hypothetical protein